LRVAPRCERRRLTAILTAIDAHSRTNWSVPRTIFTEPKGRGRSQLAVRGALRLGSRQRWCKSRSLSRRSRGLRTLLLLHPVALRDHQRCV